VEVEAVTPEVAVVEVSPAAVVEVEAATPEVAVVEASLAVVVEVAAGPAPAVEVAVVADTTNPQSH
jgi:hypothetical protein